MKRREVLVVLLPIYAMMFAGMLIVESQILLGDASKAISVHSSVVTSAQTSDAVAPTGCLTSSFALPAQGVNVAEGSSGGLGLSYLQRSYSRLKTQSNREFWRVFRGRAQLKDIFDNNLLFFKGGFPSLNVEYSTIVFYLRRLRL